MKVYEHVKLMFHHFKILLFLTIFYSSEPLRFQWIQEDEFSGTNLSEYTSDSLIKSDDVLNQRKSLSTTSVISSSDNQTDNDVPLLFTINPTTGVFEMNEMKHFQICFNPTQVRKYKII